MAITYNLAKLHLARNRVRRDLRDTDTAAAKFQDEEIDSLLNETAVRHFCWIVCGEPAGYTDATVAVAENAGGTDVELILTRTDTPDDVDRYNLSDPRYDTIDELFKVIRALNKGWSIGIATEATVHWLFDGPDQSADRMMLDALHGFASRDLALTAAASVWGTANQRLLSRYQPDKAVLEARRRHRTSLDAVKSYREADVEWTFPVGGDEGDAGSDAKRASDVPVIAVPLY